MSGSSSWGSLQSLKHSLISWFWEHNSSFHFIQALISEIAFILDLAKFWHFSFLFVSCLYSTFMYFSLLFNLVLHFIRFCQPMLFLSVVTNKLTWPFFDFYSIFFLMFTHPYSERCTEGNSGFKILPKNISSWRLGNKCLKGRLVDDPLYVLSHSIPISNKRTSLISVLFLTFLQLHSSCSSSLHHDGKVCQKCHKEEQISKFAYLS